MRRIINSIILSFKDNPIVFVIIILGVILQAFRTYHLTYAISDLAPHWLKLLDSIISSIFFSSGLLYYTVKAGLCEISPLDSIAEKQRKEDLKDKYELSATYFQIFDTFINIFYSLNKLIIQYALINGHIDLSKVPTINYAYLVLALPIAFGMPAFIRMFAGEIRESIEKNLLNDILSKIQDLNNENAILTFKSKPDKEYKVTIKKDI